MTLPPIGVQLSAHQDAAETEPMKLHPKPAKVEGVLPQTTGHPFSAGFDARINGANEYANPYPNDEWRWSAWNDGWENADEALTNG